MKPQNSNNLPQPENSELQDSGRREMLQKFGKFTAYAAPFTVLALAKKADAATSTGPGRHLKPGK